MNNLLTYWDSLLNTNISKRNFLKVCFVIASSMVLNILPHRVRGKEIRRHKLNNKIKPTVVRIHNLKATSWVYPSDSLINKIRRRLKGPYMDNIAQDIVEKMVEEGVKKLTDKKNAKVGWETLFSSYSEGDEIVIKPNFNGIGSGLWEVLPTTPVLNSIIKSLIVFLGISPTKIYIYDVSRNIPEIIRSRIKYPINYVQFGDALAEADIKEEIYMREKITDERGKLIKCFIPKILSRAKHLINVPVFKNHIFISCSCALKNHFGTVRFSDGRQNPDYLHPPRIEKSIVDINCNKHIREKTRLIIVDALFGTYDWKPGRGPIEWKIFSKGTPNSLFFSTDPVAIDSIISDYIEKERKIHNYEILSHRFLHDAISQEIGIHDHIDLTGNYSRINFIQI